MEKLLAQIATLLTPKPAHGYDEQDYQQVIDAISSGKLKPQNMITSKIAIDRVAEDGYRALIEEKDKHVKILVDLSKPTSSA